MDRKLVGLMAIFFIIFGLFISFMVFERPITQFTRAGAEAAVSPSKSIITAWPLSLAANGQDGSMITVFVRNEEGGGIGGKVVSLTSTLGTVMTIAGTTDKAGKASFKLTSAAPGTANLEVTVDSSVPLTQTLSIVFTSP